MMVLVVGGRVLAGGGCGWWVVVSGRWLWWIVVSCVLWWWYQRYRIFFFLIKFMGHSFNQIVKLCIFFFPEKVHEAFIQDLVGFSLFFLKVGCVFFFHIFGCFLCVFFFL